MGHWIRKKVEDYIGKRFGRVTVLKLDHEDESNMFSHYFEVVCDCGSHYVTNQNGLTCRTAGCPACRKIRAREANHSRGLSPSHRGNAKWQAIPVGRDLTLAELMEALPASSSGLD